MAHDDIIPRFMDYLESYIKSHDCFGYDNSEITHKRPFVPRSALAGFWNPITIVNALRARPEPSLGHEARIPGDIQEILEDYLAVFSILVSISKPQFINRFMSANLNDTHLPISSTPRAWTHVSENKNVLEEFQKAQWKFCPLVLDRRHYMSNLDSFHILPISNIKLLDPKADETEDDVLVYEAYWHQSCLGFLPSAKVVMKVYHMRSEEVTTTLQNEVDIYSKLQDDAFEHIVRYFGSFEQQGKITIVLEYAAGGNLLEFLEKTPPPTNIEDRVDLWRSFFRLLLGLNATHNLTDGTGNQASTGQWLLKGIHQDIRPQNILITGTLPHSNSYSISFKLTDFGTGHVRSCRSQGLDTMGDQRRANGMYSAPESQRVDNINRPQLCECDIWSLGAVASELLVWSIKGDVKRLEYQEQRCEATGKTRLAGGYHEGSFHDGECRLTVVDDEHKSLIESIDEDDCISPLVSRIILEDMLVANVGDRSNAIKTYERWETELKNLYSRGGHLGPRRGTKDSHTSGHSRFSKRQSGIPGMSSPAVDHQAWFGHPDSISSEPEPGALPYPDQRYNLGHDALQSNPELAKHVQFNRAMDGDPGPSTSHRPITPARIRRETNDSSISRSYIAPIPESDDDNTTLANTEGAFSQTPLPHRVSQRVSRTSTSLSNNTVNSGSPPGKFSRRQTMDNYWGIEEPGEPSTIQTTIDTSPTPRQSMTSPASRSSTRLSHRPTSKLLQHNSTTIFEETNGMITIDDVYLKITASEGSGIMGKLKNKQSVLNSFPRLRDVVERLKSFSGREQIFVVDDSASMVTHREVMGKTIRVLARALKEGGVDPDKKISLYYTCTNKQVELKNAKELQDNIAKHNFSKGPCNFSEKLDDITSDVLKGDSPISFYVFTNGRWDADPEDPEDLRGLDTVIGKILTDNKQKARRNNHVGFQFVRFFHGGPEDDVGKQRLEYLDDHLADRFKGMGQRKSDIIDTTDRDGDICKMLLGGVYTEEDNATSP